MLFNVANPVLNVWTKRENSSIKNWKRYRINFKSFEKRKKEEPQQSLTINENIQKQIALDHNKRWQQYIHIIVNTKYLTRLADKATKLRIL